MAIRAQINLRLLMFTVVFTALFITLGFWQLERAVEKTVQDRAARPPFKSAQPKNSRGCQAMNGWMGA